MNLIITYSEMTNCGTWLCFIKRLYVITQCPRPCKLY